MPTFLRRLPNTEREQAWNCHCIQHILQMNGSRYYLALETGYTRLNNFFNIIAPFFNSLQYRKPPLTQACHLCQYL